MPLERIHQLDLAGKIERHEFHGVTVRAYRRSYLQAEKNPAFCGGMRDDHRWLSRGDLFKALEAVGFGDIETAHDEPGHPYGPAVSIFARK